MRFRSSKFCSRVLEIDVMLADMGLSDAAEEDALLEDKGIGHASSNHWGPPSSAPIAVPKSSSKPAFVPKLLLPTSQSPGAVVGKTPCCQVGLQIASLLYVMEGETMELFWHPHFEHGFPGMQEA